MQKHICSFCLSQGRISGHPEEECQNSKLKNLKNVSESLKALGSTNNVSQAVVVDKNDVQFFTHPDAKCRDDVSVNTSYQGP